jgi:LacI family transcriptional regulator
MIFGTDRNYDNGVLRGIGWYARGCPNWALVSLFAHRRLAEVFASLKPAGIIIGECCQGIAGILRRVGRPIVSTCLALAAPHFHQVVRDEASIGSLAANHLIECGLRNFGYFGPPWSGPDSHREGSFRQTLQRLSHTVSVCYVRPPGSNPTGGTFEPQKYILRWIRQLPKPAGVFAPNDLWALWLCGVCRQEGIRVPEDVAIIGAENDELLCDLSHPSLSSVATPNERVGYEAAAMLDQLMNGDRISSRPLLLPAVGVVTRQSTSILAGVEPIVSAATNFIRQHISEPITVADMLRHTNLPRRSFERKFRVAIGRSPAQEIRRMRVAMAKTLLIGNPRMKMASIARCCGFARTTQFFTAFHQATGVTPSEYRRTMDQKSR